MCHNGEMSEPSSSVDRVDLSENITSYDGNAIPKDVVVGEERIPLINMSKVRKLVTMLGISLLVGVAASIVGTSLHRIINQNLSYIGAESGGKFDPTLGQPISCENGKALMVVHDGYNLEVKESLNDDPEYLQYQRSLDAQRALYLSRGDCIVEVVTDYSVSQGYVDLEPKQNTMYLVTQANTPFTTPVFSDNGVSYDQVGLGVWQILRDLGVNELYVAGENRSLCAGGISIKAGRLGFDTALIEEAVYPKLKK